MLILLTTALAAPPIGHCAPTERVRFSCTVSKGRTVSLCESAKGLSYRFGATTPYELQLPATGFSPDFEIGHRKLLGDGEIFTASIWNEGHRYTLSSKRTEDQFEAAIVVRKGAEKLATLPCKSPASIDFTELSGRYSGDPSSPGAWVGQWASETDEADLKITGDAKALHLEGEAIWHQGPDRIHTGEASGTLAGSGADRKLVSADESGCEIELHRVGPDQLEVKDNLSCGGLNVSFSGTYYRQP